MFKNYFKTAWRNLSRNKAYSIINVFGLTLGIASCLVIYLVVQYELSYDRFNTKADRIYRVTLNAIDFNPCVSMAIAPAMRNDFTELEAVSQAWYHETGLVTIADTRYDEKGILFADKYFPSVFDYQWLQGDSKSALAEPNAIVLTKTTSVKYFGDGEPMGRMINLDNKYNLKVTGIIDDVPGNTHLPFNSLVSFETVSNDVRGMMTQFFAIPGGSFAYIVTPENSSVSQFQSRIKGFIAKNWGTDIAKDANLLLQPLTDIHFDQRYLNNTISYTTSRNTYFALSAVAMLILIIACINFINLATARAIRRAKEVGVRKVLGSNRGQLITQFLAETGLMVVSALVLGLLVTFFFLPAISRWLEMKINISQLMNLPVLIWVLVLTIVVILLAGLYPAFVQSAFNPAASLKSKTPLSYKGLTLRKSLVVLQFAISQVMIVGTLVVAYQMDYFQNRDLGFNKEAVISFGIPEDGKREVLKQQLLVNPGVTELSLSSGAPVLNNYFTSLKAPEYGVTKDDVTELKFIDETYMDMFDMKLLAGEKIRVASVSEKDTVFNVVVNETLVYKLGIRDLPGALGKHIFLNGNWDCTITGVVADFQSESKHKKIRSCVLIYRPDNFFMASVRIQPSNIHQTITSIGKAWSALFPKELFSYEFLDDHIAAWYRQEQRAYAAFKLFSIVAILIGSLGLYGLVAFAAVQRTKEVGIRKVLGASVSNIILLFSREFTLLIAIAFVIAAPVAYYMMYNWLQSFAYKVSIGPGIFALAVGVSFVIAAITIAYEAIKAAVANPVKSLKSE